MSDRESTLTTSATRDTRQVDEKTLHAADTVDVVVVGAGFAGLWPVLPAARARFDRARFPKPATTSGGTWYWNRYPARGSTSQHRLHVQLRPDWRSDWEWSEKYAPNRRSCATSNTSPTVRPAPRHPVPAPVTHAGGTTQRPPGGCAPTEGDDVCCRFLVMATGCLSMPKDPDVEGLAAVHRRGLPDGPLATRTRRLHRQAGRGDRHGILWHSGDPADRAAGPGTAGVPAHPCFVMPARNGR